MAEALTNEQYEECKKQFLALEEQAITMNHYQLARETYIEEPRIWKLFLTDPRTVEYMQQETDLIRNAAINSLISKSPESRSVGEAQLINSLLKIQETNTAKDGPVFIYCYVPLNNEQLFAPDIVIFDEEEEEEDVAWNIDDSKFDRAEKLPTRR